MKSFVFTLLIFTYQAIADVCPENHYWVGAHPRKAYVKGDGNSYSATSVVGHCRSRSPAYDYWTNRIREGKIDGWPRSNEKFKGWTGKEIESLIKALDSVPRFLWAEVDLYRATKSEIKGNPSSSADGVVVIYDAAVANSKNMARILAHELSHELYRKMSDMQITEYSRIAGWEFSATKRKYMFRHSRSFVAPDSDNGPDEDFANNLEYFLFEPTKLRIKDAALFDWFSVEYGDKIKGVGEVKK